jgi:hypothetical protein
MISIASPLAGSSVTGGSLEVEAAPVGGGASVVATSAVDEAGAVVVVAVVAGASGAVVSDDVSEPLPQATSANAAAMGTRSALVGFLMRGQASDGPD